MLVKKTKFWQLPGGSWQVAVGRWQSEGGIWQLVVGSWEVVVSSQQVAGGFVTQEEHEEQEEQEEQEQEYSRHFYVLKSGCGLLAILLLGVHINIYIQSLFKLCECQNIPQKRFSPLFYCYYTPSLRPKGPRHCPDRCNAVCIRRAL